jgi:hypothetical protein
MSDWLPNLPVPWMALVVFLGTYFIAALIYLIVMRLAVDEQARAFKALSPGMLPPLGIIFGLLVGFIAVQVWSDFDRAKLSVTTEASALRAVILLSQTLPKEQETHIRALINRHVEVAVNQEWPAMAHERATLTNLPVALMEALKDTLALKPTDDTQRMVQRDIIGGFQNALDARRQRIIISQSTVGSVKWAGLILLALCTLIAIAMVHSDNRLTCAIALTLFATGIAMSVLLISAYSRPFTGDISVGPDLLQQVSPNISAITRQ